MLLRKFDKGIRGARQADRGLSRPAAGVEGSLDEADKRLTLQSADLRAVGGGP